MTMLGHRDTVYVALVANVESSAGVNARFEALKQNGCHGCEKDSSSGSHRTKRYQTAERTL